MKDNSDWMELWGDDGRWYDWNLATKEKFKITEFSRLINKLAELLNADEKDDFSKISYLKSQLPPLYSVKEVELLEKLIVESVDKTNWEQLDLFTVTEPKRIAVDRLTNHPFNSGIYGESEDVSELANQIKISGWVKPLSINLKGEILGGNRRKLAIDLLAEKGHVISEVDIEIKRFGSSEEELQFLILDNASRVKTPYQVGREAQYLQMTWEAISAKDKSELSPEQLWFIEQWDAKKEEVKEKRGTAKIKTRDVVGAMTGMSGDQHRKMMRILWVVDVLKSLDRSQEAQDFINTLNDESVNKAYLKYQEWQKENPTDYIYTGEQYGALSPNDKVEFIHSAKDSDPNYCYVRLTSDGESIRVLRKFLAPVNKNAQLSSAKLKKSSPKFEVGDRIIYQGKKGEISKVDCSQKIPCYRVTFEDQSLAPSLGENLLERDDSWNPDDFGDIDRQQEEDGQGVIFQAQIEEPPDPDDFDTTAGYDSAYKKWRNKPQPNNDSKQPLSIKDFKVGEFYSDGNSVARLLSKSDKNLILQWLGMGDSPAPRGCEYYPHKGIEVHIESECGKALRLYKFDPFDPPRFVERKLQKDDLVCPKWNKHSGTGKGRVIGYCDGLVRYQEDSGEEHRLSEDKLFLLTRGDFSVGDTVLKLIPDFPWQPQLEGRISALYSNCCDVKFEGFESPCRLMYVWLDKVVHQRDLAGGLMLQLGDLILYNGKPATFNRYLEEGRCYIDLKEVILGRKKTHNKSIVVPLSEIRLDKAKIVFQKLNKCEDQTQVMEFFDSDLFESLDDEEVRSLIKDLWVKLFEEKF